MGQKFNPTWHVFVGRNLGAYLQRTGIVPMPITRSVVSESKCKIHDEWILSYVWDYFNFFSEIITFKQKCVVVSLLLHWILKKSTRLFDVKTQTSSPKWIVGQKNNIAEKNIQKNMEEDPLWDVYYYYYYLRP